MPEYLLSVEAIARICHEANRAYCIALGDPSQPVWEQAPEWQKDSAIKGVIFHRQYPDASASSSHDSWLEVKKAEGWKYGPVKNPETKEHPCYVPYDQLPPAQQVKDHLFKTIVALTGELRAGDNVASVPQSEPEPEPETDSEEESTDAEAA